MEKRLAFLYPDEKIRDAKRPEYMERLDYELKTIITMKFPGYFLIVQDFINWSKRNGVPVGPGRGSGASPALRAPVRTLPESGARLDA